jgi:hypothetical protein
MPVNLPGDLMHDGTLAVPALLFRAMTAWRHAAAMVNKKQRIYRSIA